MPHRDTLNLCLDLLSGASQTRAAGRLPSRGEILTQAETVWPNSTDEVVQALSDPYLAVTMLWRTLGCGFR